MRSSAHVAERVPNALQGKRVVITRAADQSVELVAELSHRGAEPLLLPMVAFAPPDNPALLDEALRQLHAYDWVFITSQNTLRAIRERCDALHVKLSDLFSDVKIATVGPVTAELLANAGLHVAYVSSKRQGAALAQELANEVRSKRIFLPRSDRANPELVRDLKRLGAKVTEVCAYKTVRPEQSDSDIPKMLASADALLFFSPSAVHHLHEFIGTESFQNLSAHCLFTAIGPVTEGALRALGVDRVLLAGDTSIGAVIDALVHYLGQECDGEDQRTHAGVPVARSEEGKPG
jgi:uroporphyrinogen-III synthase